MTAEVLTAESTETKSPSISNGYLFFTFMKIGAVSFGGHAALLSVAQKIMVERDKTATLNVFTNGTSIASLLPGPMAVNVVTYVGFVLNRKRGALFSFLGILLPAFILMMLLSWLYFTHTINVHLQALMVYITGAVCAVIVSVGIVMYKKEIKGSVSKTSMALVSFLLLCLYSNYFVTVLLILAGLVTGVIEFTRSSVPSASTPDLPQTKTVNKKDLFIRVALFALVVIQVAFFADVQSLFHNLYLKIVIVFSGMSLSLFGGGYVMIPIMQSLFVHELQWLSSQEFIDAIALSQVTPGPILVSATFIGYKVAGFTGAVLATICVFVPSAFLITLISRVLQKSRHQLLLQAALNGAKVVITGMVLASAFRLVQGVHFNIITVFIFIISLITVSRLKVNPVIIIAASVLVGFVIENTL
jgi:chromate transporter